MLLLMGVDAGDLLAALAHQLPASFLYLWKVDICSLPVISGRSTKPCLSCFNIFVNKTL